MEMGLVGLLRAAWVAAILPLLFASLPLPGLGRLHEAVMGFARRAKIMQSSSCVSNTGTRFVLLPSRFPSFPFWEMHVWNARFWGRSVNAFGLNSCLALCSEAVFSQSWIHSS